MPHGSESGPTPPGPSCRPNHHGPGCMITHRVAPTPISAEGMSDRDHRHCVHTPGKSEGTLCRHRYFPVGRDPGETGVTPVSDPRNPPLRPTGSHG